MLDCLLFDGLRSVLRRFAKPEDESSGVRRKLLETRMRHQLGQIDDFELGQIESMLLSRMNGPRAHS